MQPSQALASWRKLSAISGWFSLEAAMTFSLIDEVQKKNAISGSVFEIGTHHGRSAVLLASMLAAQNESLAVCDIFDQQQGNVSQSGLGDRQIFEQNVVSLLPSRNALQLFACLSNELTEDQIGRGYRFFHIDGGHDTGEALGDLRLAARTLVPGGVIALDDAFRDVWPGVTEALLLFLQEFPDFVGLAVGFNKMFFTQKAYVETYRKMFLDRQVLADYQIRFPWHVKQVMFASNPILVYYVPESLKLHTLRNVSRKFVRGWGKGQLPILTRSVSY
jgi:hypothetical protein